MRRVGFSRNLSPCCFPMRFVSLGLCFALVSVNLALMRFGVRATTMRKNGFSSSAQSVRGSDVLVKFRDNASENDKNNVALLHGTIRGKKLKGQSGIEKFQVPVGQSPKFGWHALPQVDGPSGSVVHPAPEQPMKSHCEYGAPASHPRAVR